MRYEYYNPNPKLRHKKDGTPMGWHVGDCSTRALSKALDLGWLEVFKLQCEEATKRCVETNSLKVCDAILTANGFTKGKISQEWIKRHHRRPTVEMVAEWAKDNLGYKKLVFECNSRAHLTAVENNTLYDVWDCSDTVAWKFWYKV